MRIIIISVYLAAFLCSVRSQAPQIVEDIFTEVKRKGETGYLNCTVSRQALNKVEWHQVDQQNINVISSNTKILALNQIEKGKYKYEIIRQVRPNDKITYTLVVNRLREFDNGRYLCIIHIQGVNQVEWPQRYGNMTVQVPPTIIVSQTSNTIQKQQGQDVTLTCNATGNPTPNITWIRADGMPLPNSQFRHRGHNLTIRNIKKDDRGTYRCVADNNVVPPDAHDAQLVVYFKPEAEAVQDTVGQAQNRRFHALLECRIKGMPEPNLKWYMDTKRGEVKLSDNEKYDLNQLLSHGTSLLIGEVWYTLKILNVQANDYTMYYCEGSNAQGSNRASIRLYRTNECQGPDCPTVCITCKTHVTVETVTDTTAIVLLDVTHIPRYPQARGWRVQCEDTFTQGSGIALELEKEEDFGNGTVRLTLEGLTSGREYHCLGSQTGITNGTGWTEWTDSFFIRTQQRSTPIPSPANSFSATPISSPANSLINGYKLAWTAPETHGWPILTYHLNLVLLFLFRFLF